MIRAIEMRKGGAVIYEDQLFTVHECQHVAKGNKRSYIQAKLKNLQSGQLIDVRFRVDDQLDQPFLQDKQYEFLYDDGTHLVLMDLETFDQIPIDREMLGEGSKFLTPNIQITCQTHEGNIITASLPNTVELTVKETPPVVKGATATNQNKDALLDSGARIKVPPFVEVGEVVRVDTRTGQYIERAR